MKYRVLVVDDDTLVAESFRDRLEQVGIYDATVATDPYVGLKLAAEESFDAFLVDQKMPGMSGEVFIRNLLEIDHDPLIYVISAVDDNRLVAAAQTDRSEGGLPVKKYVDKLESNKKYLFSIDLKEDIREHRLKRKFLQAMHINSVEARQVEHDLAAIAEKLARLRRREAAMTGALTAVAAIHHELNNLNAIYDSKATLLDYLREDLDGLIEIESLRKMLNISESIRQTSVRFSESMGFLKSLVGRDAVADREYHPVAALLEGGIEMIPSELRPLPRIEISCEAGLLVRGSGRELEHALFQIILNAVEAVGLGGGRVRISAFIYGESVRILVEDEGKGISEEEAQLVFIPFYQQGKVYGGRGGSIAHKIIVHNHQGRIDICAREDRPGTRVTIDLPGGAFESELEKDEER